MHIHFILDRKLQLIVRLSDRSFRDSCKTGFGEFPIESANRFTQQFAAAAGLDRFRRCHRMQNIFMVNALFLNPATVTVQHLQDRQRLRSVVSSPAI